MSPETHAPGWEWFFVAGYFFVAGVSAGAYFIGSLAELFGDERHKEISRTGYYIAFPLVLLTPPLLIGDLGRPERFWHLMLHGGTGIPYVNLQSPLSVGSWALLVFGGISLLSFLDNLVAEGKLRSAPFAAAYRRLPRKLYAAFGSAAGFFVAGYTGVVLNITARPLWAASDPLVGALFIASSASTGAAAIYLVLAARKMLPGLRLAPFERFERLAKIIEIVLAITVVLIAGKFAAPLLRGGYAAMYWGGAVLLGMLVPLAVGWYAKRTGAGGEPSPGLATAMAVLVLLGGAFLRISLVQAGQV
ncbi:MAG: polysulfide reductase NrfD [Deltaproteobacteria bacterium]|nr:polysulfide reductase NrfD [Deltaproteobacteria bacterium]